MKNLLYIQLLSNIKQKILDGHLKPGDMLPSENELSEEYKISRITVRKSLSLLRQEGYIYPAPGKGYFVREPEIDKYILSFNEMSSSQGTMESKILEVNVILPDSEIIHELQISKNKYIIYIRRLLFSMGKLIGYDIKYMPYEKGLPIIEREIKYASFPELMSKKSSLFSIRKNLKIKSTISKGEISNLLGVEDNHPLLEISQKLFSIEDKIIGSGKTYYLGDDFELFAEWSFGQGIYENS